jgi:hypothetical protein
MTVSKKINIPQLEDEILNALNSILMLCYGNDIYKDVEKEITRIVSILEKKKLINKRLVSGQIHYPDRYYNA